MIGVWIAVVSLVALITVWAVKALRDKRRKKESEETSLRVVWGGTTVISELSAPEWITNKKDKDKWLAIDDYDRYAILDLAKEYGQPYINEVIRRIQLDQKSTYALKFSERVKLFIDSKATSPLSDDDLDKVIGYNVFNPPQEELDKDEAFAAQYVTPKQYEGKFTKILERLELDGIELQYVGEVEDACIEIKDPEAGMIVLDTVDIVFMIYYQDRWQYLAEDDRKGKLYKPATHKRLEDLLGRPVTEIVQEYHKKQ